MTRDLRGVCAVIGARMPDQPQPQPQPNGSSMLTSLLTGVIGFFFGVAVGARACMR